MSATAQAEAPRRRFTADEVYRMVEVGILDEDERVELLDGELCTMSPQGTAHSAFTVEFRERLQAAFGEAAHMRDHSPVRVSEYDLPEPDLAVVRGAARDYRARLPEPADVHLVVEIAASSRRRDLRKATIYARGGIAAYWLVDLDDQSITVFSAPADDGYQRARVLRDADVLEVAGERWVVASLFG
jgi:Uma2 family endonuclease